MGVLGVEVLAAVLAVGVRGGREGGRKGSKAKRECKERKRWESGIQHRTGSQKKSAVKYVQIDDVWLD